MHETKGDVMFKRIVIGLDGSDDAAAAIPAAVELAKAGGGEVVIAHVVERIGAKGDMAPVYADEDEIKQQIEAEAEKIRGEGVEARVETATVILGGPAHSIEEIADQAAADLIVVGAKGRAALTALLVGSVPDRLLRISSRPVLVVPAR
jgi:nucleotide-binding universal stress UspA family protein